ncbi:DNA-binding protein [Agromyces sp. CFH 90414]|uniref:DNA-binding protein n=1 Tax=Agromyces agglutinans TaxID=2662258 RepID=A0A6I2FFP2_9MICO|nr:Rv2175c family DNA-binding protein [Agromyces agglutinans]MRG61510.1 DNA-binding protein [Agromyces agglutinans]
MTDAAEPAWLTVPDLVERTGQTPSRIRKLIDERHLLATRIDGVLKVPADFLRDDLPLPELHGTAMVLADAGFSDEEAVAWLISEDDSLGTTPIAALRAGRKSEVRRVAQALA